MSQPAADLADRMAALRAQGIHSVLATFTDLNGGVKGKLVPLELLPQAVAEGAGFSGPSITGTGLPRRGPRSEYMGRVLPQTLQPWPLLPGVAHAVCDGHAGGDGGLARAPAAAPGLAAGERLPVGLDERALRARVQLRRRLSDDEVAWKQTGTRAYQQLTRRCIESLWANFLPQAAEAHQSQKR